MSEIKVIEVKDLTKYYPEVLAVNRVNFSVFKGQVVGFLGPNGAGKTTTLKMLTCFMPPTSGEAWVCGCNITGDPTGVRRNIGYLPEHNALYEEMRVREYLTFRAALKGVEWRLRKRWVDEAMETCRLEEMADRVIGHLSKGFRQRVGLADTLVHKPPVLIFDEPTVGLDPAQIIEVRALIKKLSEKNTVLLSTHYLSEVEQICDHVVVITRGKVVAADSLENLTRSPDGGKTSLEDVFLDLTGGTASEEDVAAIKRVDRDKATNRERKKIVEEEGRENRVEEKDLKERKDKEERKERSEEESREESREESKEESREESKEEDKEEKP